MPPPKRTKYIKTKSLVEGRRGNSRGVIRSRSMASHIRSGVAQAGKEYNNQGQESTAVLTGYVRDIQYVMSCFQTNQRKVANIKAYLLSMLFNATATMTSHYDNAYISRFKDG